MTSKIRLSQFRKLIAEETLRVLKEVGEKENQEKEDSLDAQVDKFLVGYEAESKAAKNEGKDFRSLVRRFLVEADEEDKKDEKEEDSKSSEETKKLKAEDIDLENFANSVMRLVDNYDALLEVRNTILRRAVNFLLKGYEPDVAQAFKDSVMDLYDIEIGKSKLETEDDEYQVPAADRAGSSPGGA